MRARVFKWGNSLAVRLPKAAAESLRVGEGEAVAVDLSIEGDKLVIRARPPRYTLEQLVAEMRPEDHPEVRDEVSAPPEGQEVL